MLPLHLPEEAISTNEVINQLLHHVGAMCIHQLNLLATNPNLPITSVLGKQHPIEARHLSSICDIMEKAMVNGDTCIVRCILVVFQVHIQCEFSKMTDSSHLLPEETPSAISVFTDRVVIHYVHCTLISGVNVVSLLLMCVRYLLYPIV